MAANAPISDDRIDQRTEDFIAALEDADDLDVERVRSENAGTLREVHLVANDPHQRANLKRLANHFKFGEADWNPINERNWSRPGRVGYVEAKAEAKYITAEGGL